MRTSLLLLSFFALGCASRSSYVHSDAALGRVVVYRNGVAYFERYAEVDGSTLSLAVPSDKVDDFLKSLTVVDATTGKPAPVAFPTQDSADEDKKSSGLIDMKIQLSGPAPHKLRVSYVTEAPSWKPTYRVLLSPGGKVTLQAWAIVDNTSGEDWNAVKLGVGASSALSFRYDLRSIRSVQRETLESNDVFAQAPPTGASVYGGVQKAPPSGSAAASEKGYAYEFSDDALASGLGAEISSDARIAVREKARSSVEFRSVTRESAGNRVDKPQAQRVEKKAADASESVNGSVDSTVLGLKKSTGRIVVEGYADARDGDKEAAALARANRVREHLVRSGVAPDRVVAVAQGAKPDGKGGVRIVESPPPTDQSKGRLTLLSEGTLASTPSQPTDPIGISHFESPTPMSVPRGTSAMISILASDTVGEVVYLYDAESPRGNKAFPFRAVRLVNPSSSALESGPVSVFGEGRFIGEGLCDPIPARATAFVPFALDRQIVVERKDDESDRIARILAVQRGVFSTEVQRSRKVTFTIHNRLPERATVYLRHTVPKGFSLTNAPPKHERVGEAHLFRVEVEPGARTDVSIEQATPVTRTTDIRSQEGLGLVRAFVSSAAADGPLKEAVKKLIDTSNDVASLEQQIVGAREQMVEYRQRMGELAGQLVALKAVKMPETALVRALEKKLQEVNEKVSQATISVVGLQEKLMVAKIRFQDGVAELSLEAKPGGASAQTPAK